MDTIRSIALISIGLSVLVLGAGLVYLRYFVPAEEQAVALNTNWNDIEDTVVKDIGLVGYQFLTHGSDIPALAGNEYEGCLANYADLKTVGPEHTREYLFKYNQIIRIRMLRAGIDCREQE